ncbi:MAG: acylphosphatase [Bacteroidia bacterium]|nr:acylphosphatase [Bacteroidia bacterium]
MGLKTVTIEVFGKVQGVYYRQSAQKRALELGITGMVRNRPEGTVFIHATGDEEDVMAFVNWCKDGPMLAHVDKVDVIETPLTIFNGFVIER